MNPAAFAIMSAGLVIFLVSLPLIYRKIPMNAIYGIRIPAAFESNERWYEINEYGGRQMAAWAWLPIAAGAVGLFIRPEHLPLYLLCSVPVTLLGLVIPLIRIMAWARASRAGKTAIPGMGGAAQPRTVAGRLRELETLHTQRLASDSEYADQRQKILHEL